MNNSIAQLDGSDAPTSKPTAQADCEAISGPTAISHEPSKVVAFPSGVRTGGRGVQELLERYSVADGEIGFSEKERTRMRQIFRRYVSAEREDVNQADLVNIFSYLGYLGVDEDLVEEISSAVSNFDNFSLQDVGDVAERVCAREQELLRLSFEDFAIKHGAADTVPFETIPELLRSMGVMALRGNVDEAFSFAGLGGQKSLNFGEFKQVLAFYMSMEGFSCKEFERANTIFEETLDEGAPCFKAKDAFHLSELMGAVLKNFGLYAVDHAKRLFGNLLDKGSSRDLSTCDLVGFDEFLVWSRRLNNLILDQQWALFMQIEEDGLVSAHQLQGALLELGYSVANKAVVEFLETAKVTVPLDFDGFVRFVDVCNRQNGFRTSEAADYEQVFNRFDYKDNGEIEELGVLDIIRYIGYNVTFDAAHELIKQVDYNDNGSLDLGEFMRLLRLQTEGEMVMVRMAFHSHRSSTKNALTLNSLRSAITAVGMEVPHDDDMGQIFEGLGSPESFDFDAFTEIVFSCRRFQINLKRLRANFEGKDLENITAAFKRYAGSSVQGCTERDDQFLHKCELFWLLKDMEAPIETFEDRARIPSLLVDARACLVYAGAKPTDIGEGEERVTLLEFMHLLRGFTRHNESKKLRREAEVLENIRFNALEVAEFRTIFRKFQGSAAKAHGQRSCNRRNAVVAGGGGDVSNVSKFSHHRVGRRASDSSSFVAGDVAESEGADGSSWNDAGDNDVSRDQADLRAIIVPSNDYISADDARQMLSFVGVRFISHQRTIVDSRLRQLAQGKEGLDFADFLRFIRWMLDNNIASVDKVAAGVANE
jgi:Ca2+-binding EF-hand superfamily protein